MFQISRAERLEMIMRVVLALVQNPAYLGTDQLHAPSTIAFRSAKMVDAILEETGYDTENFY